MTQNKEWLKVQILRRYLEGFSQEEIAKEFGISEGKVSLHLQELREQDETLTVQHEIAVVCKKYNIPIIQLASNLAVSNAIKRKAYDGNKIDLLLRTLNKMIVEDGSFLPEKAGIVILEICNFMETKRLESLEQAYNIINENSNELKGIKEKISESKKQAAKAKEKEMESLRKRRLTWGELRRFSFARKVFENAGINFINFEKFSNVISVIYKLDSNPELIIKEMKKTHDLESRKISLGNDCEEIEKNLEALKKQQQERISYYDSYHVAVDLINKTLVHGFGADLVIRLFATILSHKLYAPIEDFINDIDTYGGTKSAIFKAKRELENLTRQKGELLD